MAEKRSRHRQKTLLQSRIAGSSATLPVAVAWAAIVWVAYCRWADVSLWHAVAYALTAYIIAETNTTFALLRLRSRMISSTYLMLSCAIGMAYSSWGVSVGCVSMSAAMFILLGTYQEKTAAGRVYYAFLLVGACSLLEPHVLLLIPVLWLIMGIQLHSLSVRTWLGSLVGLATPFWLLVPYCLLKGVPLFFTDRISPPTNFCYIWPPIGEITAELHSTYGALSRAVYFVLLTVLVACSTTHLAAYGYEDKIRVRQMLWSFAYLWVAVVAIVLLQPQAFDSLMPLATLTASPLVAHFFTFTHKWQTNLLFCASLALTIGIAAFSFAHTAKLI